jgi:amino-acid N-acetyltransferase
MDTPTVTLRPADDDALAYVERRLVGNDLPAEDVRSKPDCFYVGYAGDEPVGVGGIEVYGRDGLLRSVVVEASVRGDGYGTALCSALETEAQRAGVETLYLLTTTASAFFAARRYETVERTDAPERIRATSEFTDLCPESAVAMRKSLSDT